MKISKKIQRKFGLSSNLSVSSMNRKEEVGWRKIFAKANIENNPPKVFII